MPIPNGTLDGPVIASDGIHEIAVTDDSYRWVATDRASWGVRTGSSGGGSVADGRDLGSRAVDAGLQERLQRGDVVGLDDVVDRVLRECEPVADHRDARGIAVDEAGRAAL